MLLIDAVYKNVKFILNIIYTKISETENHLKFINPEDLP